MPRAPTYNNPAPASESTSPRINKSQLQPLPGLQGLRKDDCDQVIPVPGQLRSLDCLIVDELDRMPVRFHLLDLEGSR